ncbi:hypothetical protein ABH917_003799 [Thermobifida halotolerans]|uniref:hypothetical protein n=1 Tax=Thermobifida halotolerans TaxID=483545 RepID=UPI003516C48C
MLLKPDYYHGPSAAATWAGLASVVVGTVLTRRRDSRWEPRPRGGLLGMVSGVAVAVLVAAAAWWSGAERAVRHTTVEAVAPQPVPETVSGIAWTWEAPEDMGSPEHSTVRDLNILVLSTAAGAVVETGDGVIALDTATGEETWQYRLAGVTVWAGVSSDGRTVELVLRHDGWEGKPYYGSIFLDAATGEILQPGAVPQDLDFSGGAEFLTEVAPEIQGAATRIPGIGPSHELRSAPGAILAVDNAAVTVTGLA